MTLQEALKARDHHRQRLDALVRRHGDAEGYNAIVEAAHEYARAVQNVVALVCAHETGCRFCGGWLDFDGQK